MDIVDKLRMSSHGTSLDAAIEIEKLREALKPFAYLAEECGYRIDSHLVWGIGDVKVTFGDFRRAYTVLTGKELT